jgi:hypothetical protein
MLVVAISGHCLASFIFHPTSLLLLPNKSNKSLFSLLIDSGKANHRSSIYLYLQHLCPNSRRNIRPPVHAVLLSLEASLDAFLDRFWHHIHIRLALSVAASLQHAPMNLSCHAHAFAATCTIDQLEVEGGPSAQCSRGPLAVLGGPLIYCVG